MQHDAAVQPSQVSAVYWIEAKDASGRTPPPTPRSGQWLIRVNVTEVDEVWARVKQATEAGELGYKAKVSTAPVPGERDPRARLICVCTYDSHDAAEVERVGTALRALDMEVLHYRTDQE